MTDRLWKVAEFLLAVDVNDKSQIRRWRLLVGLIMLLFCAHILWAAGAFQSIGLSGSASRAELQADMASVTSQMKNQERATTKINVTLLEQAMLTATTQRCQAASKMYFTNVLLGLQDQYYALEGHAF